MIPMGFVITSRLFCRAGRLALLAASLPRVVGGRDLPLPVLPLDREALGSWSALLMGHPA